MFSVFPGAKLKEGSGVFADLDVAAEFLDSELDTLELTLGKSLGLVFYFTRPGLVCCMYKLFCAASPLTFLACFGFT